MHTDKPSIIVDAASMAADNFKRAVETIDARFGQDYARRNPQVLIATLQNFTASINAIASARRAPHAK